MKNKKVKRGLPEIANNSFHKSLGINDLKGRSLSFNSDIESSSAIGYYYDKNTNTVKRRAIKI